MPLVAWFDGKKGLEVGGPSRFFQPGQHLPIYPRVAALDNCNFAAETVWEGALAEGPFQLGDRVVGRQYICEATQVAARLGRPDYDFVISSNCLEHVANPLAAIEAWLDVLRPGGKLVVVVPNKRSNFDWKRPVTTFEHVMDDYEANVGEEDLSHVEEIVRLTDLRLSGHASLAEVAAFLADNIKHRCVHHHVFDEALLDRIARHFALENVATIDAATDYVLIAEKPGA